jgi:hypothetical protein
VQKSHGYKFQRKTDQFNGLLQYGYDLVDTLPKRQFEKLGGRVSKYQNHRPVRVLSVAGFTRLHLSTK